MVQLKCPQCATLVSGAPGVTIECPNCGYHAKVPGGPAAAGSKPSSGWASGSAPRTLPPPPPPAPWEPPKPMARQPQRGTMKPQPAEPATPALNVMSVWAYLIGILAVGTFFLARFGLPFILAVLALIIGVGAYVRDKQDRRALVASVLGALAIVLAVVYLALR